MFDIFNFQPQYNWYSNIRMTFIIGLCWLATTFPSSGAIIFM